MNLANLTNLLRSASNNIITSKRLMIGLILAGSIVFLGIFAPWIAPYPTKIGLFRRELPPSPEHILGTDTIGRDVFSMLIMGIRNTLLIGFLSGSISIVLGTLIGLTAAYKTGIISELLRRTIDVFLVIPVFPLLLVISAAFVRQVLNYVILSLIIAIFGWPGAARRFYSQVLSLKEEAFVKLAKLCNMSDFEILIKEIMPNMLSYIGATFGMTVSAAMVTETGLSLIGLGPSNSNTIGMLLYWTRFFAAITRGKWWWFLPPALVLIFFFIGVQLINMGLDEVFNPKLKMVTGK